jgi:hypothetical protein
MATVEQVAGTEEVPVAPQPAAPPPPPPGSQPVVGADGRPVARTTRRTVKRRPIPRGTAAISGGAVAGTLLTVMYAAAGPVALVATAAGAVAIPLVIWRNRSNSRTGRRSTARRAARQQSTRGTGGGWLGPGRGRSGGRGSGAGLSGLGGGGGRGRGSRSAGRSLFGAGAGGGKGRKGGLGLGLGSGKGGSKAKGSTAKGSTTGAASGGLGAKSRRKDGSRTVGGRGGRARQVTPKLGRKAGGGVGAGAGRMPKSTGRGAAGGGWKPPKGASSTKASTSRGAASKSSPKAAARGAAGGWKPPKNATSSTKPGATAKPFKPAKTSGATASGGTSTSPKVKKVNRTRGYGPQGRGGRYGAWTPPRRQTRRGRVASALNHGVWKAGSAFAHGVRKPGGKRAFRAAWRRYGAHGYNPTATGFLGRVFGGLAAAVPASVARASWMLAKKVAKSLREAYNKPVVTPAQRQQAQQQAQNQQAQAQQSAQQHPVPDPAFAGPPPAQNPRGDGSKPSPRPRQSATTGGGSYNGGTTPMSTLFPPHGPAADFYAAAVKWSPAATGQDRAIWNLHDALPFIVGSVGLISNGLAAIIANCDRDLQGAMHPAMKQALVEVFNPVHFATTKADLLMPVFARVYADALSRRTTRGGQALNV